MVKWFIHSYALHSTTPWPGPYDHFGVAERRGLRDYLEYADTIFLLLFGTSVPTDMALAFDAADEKAYLTALQRLEDDVKLGKELGISYPGTVHSFR